MEKLLLDAGTCLLVGEGNFSFALSLCQKLANPRTLTATCFEAEESVKKVAVINQRLDLLLKSGVTVIFGVDATNIQDSPQLRSLTFNVILFNFPHIKGKNNMRRNRELIKGFFISSSKSLTADGQVLLTLCTGQGGTPADKPQRELNNSWQVVSMATYGDLILTETEDFDSSVWSSYECTGFRGHDKRFNTSGAVVHVFSKSVPLQSEPCTLSHWIGRHFQRELVEDNRHPLYWTKLNLEKQLQENQMEICADSRYPTLGSPSNNVPNEGLYGETKSEGSGTTPTFSPSDTILKVITMTTENDDVQYFRYTGKVPDENSFDNLRNSIIQSEPTDECPCLYSALTSLIGSSNRAHSFVAKIYNPSPISPKCYPIMHQLFIAVRVSEETQLDSFQDYILEVLRSFVRNDSEITVNDDENPESRNSLVSGICKSFSSWRVCKRCADKAKTMSKHCIHFLSDSQEDILGEIDQLADVHDGSVIYLARVSLDHLAMIEFDISDVRLLWSPDDRNWLKFSQQIKCFNSSPGERPIQLSFSPYSMYPPSYIHDICFCVPHKQDFDPDKFYSLIRRVTGNVVSSVEYLGTYVARDEEVRQCFRLVYWSCDRALTKLASNDLQNELRRQMEAELGLIAR